MNIEKAVMENRGGIFRIGRDVIKMLPADAMAILTTVLVVRAEMDYMTDCVEYQGYSQHFDPLPRGNVLTEYIPWLERDDDRNLTITWRKAHEE